MIRKMLIGFLCLLVFAKCNYSADNISYSIQGKWKVNSVNCYPLSLSEFKDLEIDTFTTFVFIDKGMKIVFNDSLRKPKVFKFFIEGDNLNIWYGDYALSYCIEKLTESRLILKSMKGNKRISLEKNQ